MIPPLHLVTDDAVLAAEGFPERARQALEAGGSRVALHLRGPGTSGRHLWQVATALVPAARDHGALLLVNDRVDVALCTGTHGVHLGRRSLPVRGARALLPEGSVVGASVHDGQEAWTVVEQEGRPDFLMVGAIHPTATHPGREGRGIEVLAEVAATTREIPLVAIGGITPDRVGEVLRSGAAGVAVIRGVWAEPEPARAVERYLERLEAD